MMLDIESINKRIDKEICYKTIEKLNDKNLMVEFEKSLSVKNKYNEISSILNKYLPNKLKSEKREILNEILPLIIPSGTKGVIRGNLFNNIVKENIMKINLDKSRFKICFEKNCDLFKTDEKPDWFIIDNKTNKYIIGMNQIDLWNGGQQLNRGFKYLKNTSLKNGKLLCVVCNEIKLKKENKKFELFKIGYKNDTLCFLNNLENIISKFFLI